jgi:hypothetical protein
VSFQANRDAGLETKLIPNAVANALFCRYDLAPTLPIVSVATFFTE